MECILWRLPTEILDLIFNMYFNDLDPEDDEFFLLHFNTLLWMLTPLPRRDVYQTRPRRYHWGYMGWENKFPKQLTISVDWCRLAIRSWLRNRFRLFVSFDNIELEDFSHLGRKTWTLFERVDIDVSTVYYPGKSINHCLQQLFCACPNIRELELSGTDDLRYGLEDCLTWFPDENGHVFGGEPPIPEAMFGTIDWIKTLSRHEKLERVRFTPGELCRLEYGQWRDQSAEPDYPSVEMYAALEALEEYINDKLWQRELDKTSAQRRSSADTESALLLSRLAIED